MDQPEQESGTAETLPAAGSVDQTLTAAPKDPGALPSSMQVELTTVTPDKYVLETEVGRGGMGRVMRATDTRHGRVVAVKEMIGGSADMLRRFEREALITARLQHPSIVPVYEAGQWPDGSPFYAMKLVEGKSLDQLISGRELEERVALLPELLAVAEALAYAHSRNIIHRDLKPSNIIVGEYGETVVIDWGLAKEIGSEELAVDDETASKSGTDGSLTRVGSVMGTPAFMPPEQAEGRGADARSDVYALGAILYQLLAGAPPYKGRSSDEVLAQVLSEPPTPLAERVPGIPSDLRAVVDKAMARDPDDRYADANELAQELRRFQTGQLVGAHSYSRSELLKRWVARNRAAVTVAAVLMIVLLAGATWSVRQIMQERDIAQRERRTAENATRKAEGAKNTADTQRSGAENLMDYMLVDLGDRLRKDGKLDLLAGVAGKVKAYYRVSKHKRRANSKRRFKKLMLLGEIDLVKADVESAQLQFRKALKIADLRHSARHDARHGNHRRDALAEARLALDAADVRRSLGRTMFELGKHKQAASHYRDAVKVLQKLPPSKDKNVQAGLAAGFAELGAALFVKKDLDGALVAYRRSAELAHKLVAAEPKKRRWRRLLGQSETRIADIHRQRGEHDKALALLRRSAKRAQRGLDRAPGNHLARFGVAFINFKLAVALGRKGDDAQAVAKYRAAREGFVAVLKAEPKFVRAKLFLASTHSNVGLIRAKAKQYDKAIAETKKAARLIEPVVAANPTAAEWQVSLMSNYGSLAEWMAMRPGGKPAAVALADKAVAIGERLRKQGRLAPLYQRELTHLRKLRKKLRK